MCRKTYITKKCLLLLSEIDNLVNKTIKNIPILFLLQLKDINSLYHN